MIERLDLKEGEVGFLMQVPSSFEEALHLLYVECVRAQASEDALRERVRVLEDKLEFHGIPMPRGVGKETT